MGGPGEVRRRRPRTCVGCGAEAPKSGLVRIVRSPEGGVTVDSTGKASGRGAYLCRKKGCLLHARKKDALSRALRVKVPEDVYQALALLCVEEDSSCGDREGAS